MRIKLQRLEALATALRKTKGRRQRLCLWTPAGRCPAPAKGSSTLWTPFFAIQLVTSSCCFRVFMQGISPLRRRPKGFPIALWKPSAPPLLGFHVSWLVPEHPIRTVGSPDKHADTVCKCAQLNRAEGSREELPCGVKGQRPLGRSLLQHLLNLPENVLRYTLLVQ